MVAGLASMVFADRPAWRVMVDPTNEVGLIRPMNAVNGGPVRFKSNSRAWRHARIPFGRTHDMNHSWEYGGPHTIDISAVFPNFDADENDPASYDFTNTDQALDLMRQCGTEPFYRLGPSIESGVKKYHTHPPRDFAKWARISEHVIRHCNEGWADGRHYGIRYWEIWFEPDLGPRAWSGTQEQFLAFYKVAATHLKSCFPSSGSAVPDSRRHLPGRRRSCRSAAGRSCRLTSIHGTATVKTCIEWGNLPVTCVPCWTRTDSARPNPYSTNGTT